MLYKNYPTIDYKNLTISNILIRTNLLNFKNNSALFENYTINDDDTAESLSFKYYNDTNYSWVILGLNEMFNRHLDWPLSTNRLNDLLQNKYNYSSVFIPENKISFILSDVYKIGLGSARYIVRSTNRNLNLLNLQNKISTTALQSGNSVTLYDKNDVILASNVTLGRIVYEGITTLYNFQDLDGVVLDGRDTNAYLQSYINNTVEQNIQNFIVTNYDNETKINDNKRNIIILKNNYLSEYVSLTKNVLDIKSQNND